jgi:hypothetical protein
MPILILSNSDHRVSGTFMYHHNCGLAEHEHDADDILSRAAVLGILDPVVALC